MRGASSQSRRRFAPRRSVIGLLSNTFLCLGKAYGFRSVSKQCLDQRLAISLFEVAPVSMNTVEQAKKARGGEPQSSFLEQLPAHRRQLPASASSETHSTAPLQFKEGVYVNPAEKDLPKVEKIPEPKWTSVPMSNIAPRAAPAAAIAQLAPPPPPQMQPQPQPAPAAYQQTQAVSTAQRYAASRAGQPSMTRGNRAGASPPPQRPPPQQMPPPAPPIMLPDLHVAQTRPRQMSPQRAAPAAAPQQNAVGGPSQAQQQQQGRGGLPGTFPF